MHAGLPEGVDELHDDGAIVHLAFHVRADFAATGDDARREVAWRAERCAAFLRSPDYRERFGRKPGVIAMKTAHEPPPDVQDRMVQLGIDVIVAALPVAPRQPSSGVTCATCGRSGFLMPEMSMTDAGLTCSACFQRWEARQSHALAPTRRDTGLVPDRSSRVLFTVAIVVVSAILRACMSLPHH